MRHQGFKANQKEKDQEVLLIFVCNIDFILQGSQDSAKLVWWSKCNSTTGYCARSYQQIPGPNL